MKGERIKLEQIRNESKRNAVFKKRVESLTKNANELSILCGVDTGIVIHKPGENNAVLWPSPEILGERVEKFMDITDPERTKKLMVQEKYLEQKVKHETDNVSKLHCMYKQRSHEELIREMMMCNTKNLNEFDLSQLNSLKFCADEMLEKLKKRDMELPSDEEIALEISISSTNGGTTDADGAYILVVLTVGQANVDDHFV